MKFFFAFLITLFSFLLVGTSNVSGAAIDLNVIPINYEIETQTGATVTRTATLVNNSADAFTITTGTSDFVANGTDGTPRFVRYSELVYADQQLSTWIDIDTDGFVIAPGESKTVNFTITVPDNATPGGHYGAVFFKNNGSTRSTGGNVSINVDYGIIILVNVDGEVVTSGEVREPSIVYQNGWGIVEGGDASGPSISLPDSVDYCPLGDFSRSNIDGTCIGGVLTRFIRDVIPGQQQVDQEEINQGEEAENIDAPEVEQEEFEVVFEIPFENTGNTHIKPTGSITLVDEDGNTLKQIGREVIINESGAVIGENIVDYIPVNDNQGNVLPKTTRIFEGEWQGFPYKVYDDTGEQVIKHWDPGEYYTKENIAKNQFLQLWERVCERRSNKKITALINFSYVNDDGEEVEFNSAEEFEIDYVEEYIGINPFVVAPLILFLLLVFFFWLFILAKKKKRCKKCDTKVRKSWKICPKCKKKLKK